MVAMGVVLPKVFIVFAHVSADLLQRLDLLYERFSAVAGQ
jgi:hypothetical protein